MSEPTGVRRMKSLAALAALAAVLVTAAATAWSADRPATTSAPASAPAADWRTWPPDRIAEMCARMPRRTPRGESGKAELIEHIRTTWLDDPAKAVSAGAGCWGRAGALLARDMKPEERVAWGRRLVDLFASTPEKIQAIGPQDICPFVDGVCWLGARREVRGLGLAWLRGHRGQAASIDPGDAVSLIAGGWDTDKDAAEEILKFFERDWIARHEAGRLTMEQYGALLSRFRRGLSGRERADAWLSRALEAVVKPANFTAGNLAAIGQCVGPIVPGASESLHARYAAILADLIVKDKAAAPEGGRSVVYYWLALPLRTEELRGPVRAVLVDSSGRLRLDAARILGCSYGIERTTLAGWSAWLEEQAGKASGDARARWLLARAFAVQQSGGPLGFQTNWQDKALAEAASNAGRMEVLAEIISTRREGDPKSALLAVQSVMGKLAGADRVFAEATEKDLQARIARSAEAEVRSREFQKIQSKWSHLQYLRRRVVEYKDSGDIAGAAKIQEAIDRLEKELENY